ncbi:MAG: hypothetical protein H8D34_07580 [Chloroflexi bacterium]|nr:hypothetical protein [Chloroflexota bacterium]
MAAKKSLKSIIWRGSVLFVALVLFFSVSVEVSGQEENPLPRRVLETTLEKMGLPMTQRFELHYADDTAFSDLFNNMSAPGILSAAMFFGGVYEEGEFYQMVYSVQTVEATDATNQVGYFCRSDIVIEIINAQNYPLHESGLEIIMEIDGGNSLSISQLVEKGFGTEDITRNYREKGLDPSKYIGTVSFHGLVMHHLYMPIYLDYESHEYAPWYFQNHRGLAWQDGNWIFIMKYRLEAREAFRIGDVEDQEFDSIYYETCPTGNHPGIDLFEWAETLYQTYTEMGLEGGAATLPTPTVGPNVSCTLTPKVDYPLLLQVDITNSDGSIPRYQKLWMYWADSFGADAYIQPPFSTEPTWVKIGLGEEEQQLIRSDSDGNVLLGMSVDLSSATHPITPDWPLKGTLNFRAMDVHGNSVMLGSCDLSIDYIAMTDYYVGEVGYSPTGTTDSYCLSQTEISGKPAPSEFKLLRNGDVIYVGSCGNGQGGWKPGVIIINYIDNTKYKVFYDTKGDIWKLINYLDLPPHGVFFVGHEVPGLPKLSSSTHNLTNWFLNTATGKVGGKLAEEGAKFALKLVVKSSSLNPVRMVVTTVVGEFASDFIGDTIFPETLDYQNSLALRVVHLRSLLEITYDGDQVRFRTFEGDPEVYFPETDETISLPSGQEVFPFDESPIVSSFDTDAAERWWETPEWYPDPDDNLDQSNPGLGQHLDDRRKALVTVVGAGILLLLGFGFVITLAIVVGRRRGMPRHAEQVRQPARRSRWWIGCLVSIAIVLLAGCFLGLGFGGGLLSRFDSTFLQELEILLPELLPNAQDQSYAPQAADSETSTGSTDRESLPLDEKILGPWYYEGQLVYRFKTGGTLIAYPEGEEVFLEYRIVDDQHLELMDELLIVEMPDADTLIITNQSTGEVFTFTRE